MKLTFVRGQKERNDMCVEVINGMADTIAELEQKLAEREWIPVTERLPKYSGEYLVTVRNVEDKDYLYIDMSWYAYPTDYDIESGEWREVMGYEEVIAWQLLPEPYRESEG